MLSDLIESHSPVFFYAGLRFVFQLKHMQKNSAALFAVCCWTTSKRDLLFSWTMKPTKCPVAACFLHMFLLENKVQTSGKKCRAVTFYQIGDRMQKFSSFGRKKKQTKIWHRMVMLQRLQLFLVHLKCFITMKLHCISGSRPQFVFLR